MPIQTHIAIYLILVMIFIMVELLESNIHDIYDLYNPCKNAFIVFASIEAIWWLIYWGFKPIIVGV